MTYIYYAIIPVIIILLLQYFISKYRKERKLEQQKENIKETLQVTQSNYKKTIIKLFKLQLIDKKMAGKLTSIAINYFVFRTLNEKNSEKFIEIIGKLTTMLLSFTEEKHLRDNHTDIKIQLFKLTSKIPMENISFNTRFYDVKLPQLISEYSIKTMMDNLVDNKANIQKLIKTDLKVKSVST